MNKLTDFVNKIRDEVAFQIVRFSIDYLASTQYRTLLEDIFTAGIDKLYEVKPAQEQNNKESN